MHEIIPRGDGDDSDVGDDVGDDGGETAAAAEPSRPRGAPFFFNEQLLAPGLAAPVPLLVNERHGFQAAVRDLLVRLRAPAIAVEPCAVAMGNIVHGCQEIVAGCHDLIASPDPRAVDAASQRILTGCRGISGTLENAYIIRQAIEGLPDEPFDPLDGAGACARLKNLAEPLEDHLHRGAFVSSMDPLRLGRLEVSLDEIYDLACRQLERFYDALLRRAHPPVFVRFARRLYDDVFRRIAPDHIFDPVSNRPAGGAERTGLLDLLPELCESLRLRESAP